MAILFISDHDICLKIGIRTFSLKYNAIQVRKFDKKKEDVINFT